MYQVYRPNNNYTLSMKGTDGPGVGEGGEEEEKCPVTKAMEHWKWSMVAWYPFPNCDWCQNNQNDIIIFKTIYNGKTGYTEYYEMGRQLIL